MKRVEAGLSVPELCRELGISSVTFYKWRAKYRGLDASELKRIKELEAQISEFKRIVADSRP